MKLRKKKKIDPRSQKPKRKRKIRTLEIIGILFVFLTIFVFISLISYHPQDPSWANVTSADQKIHNYAGRAGASLAEALFQFLGLTAFLIPFAFLYLGFQLVFPRERRRFLVKAGGVAILLLLLS